MLSCVEYRNGFIISNPEQEENAWKFDVQMTRIAHLNETGHGMVYVLQCVQNDTQTLLNV